MLVISAQGGNRANRRSFAVLGWMPGFAGMMGFALG
jgi:hypothetical protein